MQTSERFIKSSRRKYEVRSFHKAVNQQTLQTESLKEENQSKLEHNVYLNNLLKRQRVKKIATFLQDLRGANVPMQYKGVFNFKQKWQVNHKENEFQSFKMQYIQGWYFWLKVALKPFLIAQIWFLSIFRIFQIQSYHTIFLISLIQELLTFIFKCYLFIQKKDPKQDLWSQIILYIKRGEGQMHLFKIYSIAYYTMLIANVDGIADLNNLYYLFFDAIMIIFKYSKVQYIYAKIKIKAIGSKYKNYVDLFDLLSNILIILHCFSILLFCCTYYSPQSNWMAKSTHIQKNWFSNYIISFYFASTTMLTVGYGDFIPINILEIICVFFVQLLGISFNGYAINEIGIILSRMRQEKQILQRDLANAQKLAACNKMSLPLKQKMYNEIIKHQETGQKLENTQEQSLMSRINYQVKQQIQEENQIKIAKSCLFLLCNFTKKFQIQLSKKLVKAIYPPNTTLVQTFGKQRLYIITKGSVDVLAEKKSLSRLYVQKVLKTLEVRKIKNLQLSEVYGVSAFFSRKPSRIRAVAKTFTTCYYLQHGDLQDSIMGGDQDFGRYHYLKIKYHLENLPEKYETPLIVSRKQHYVPTIFYLIKKHKIDMKGSNSRKNVVRNHRRIKKIHQMVQQFQIKESKVYQSFQTTSQFQEKMKQPSEQNKNKITVPIPRTSRDQEQILNLLRARDKHIRPRNTEKFKQLKRMRLQQKDKTLANEQLVKESYKQYKSYLPNGNISAILSRFCKKKQQLNNQNDTLISYLREKKLKKLMPNIE